MTSKEGNSFSLPAYFLLFSVAVEFRLLDAFLTPSWAQNENRKKNTKTKTLESRALGLTQLAGIYRDEDTRGKCQPHDDESVAPPAGFREIMSRMRKTILS